MSPDDAHQYALWKRHWNVRITDTKPRMIGFVVDNTIEQGAADEVHSRTFPDQTCKCGFSLCSGLGLCAPVEAKPSRTSKTYSPADVELYMGGKRIENVATSIGFSADGQAPAPNDPVRPNLTVGVHEGKHWCHCNRCAWKGEAPSRAMLLESYDSWHDCPPERFMRNDILRYDYDCSDCAWHSGTRGQFKSDEAFQLHKCADWPKGTLVSQYTCVVCGDSPVFPTPEEASAWGDDHVGCESARMERGGFKPGDKVRWRSFGGEKRAGVIMHPHPSPEYMYIEYGEKWPAAVLLTDIEHAD